MVNINIIWEKRDLIETTQCLYLVVIMLNVSPTTCFSIKHIFKFFRHEIKNKILKLKLGN